METLPLRWYQDGASYRLQVLVPVGGVSHWVDMPVVDEQGNMTKKRLEVIAPSYLLSDREDSHVEPS